ncbi:hypothetical protein HMPREF1275_00910 [Propionibacterium sp. KPL1844]|nr:hypothetical protein HMPREF1275_00910 [Propionibacterium sp. KPL1844]
MTAEPMSTLRVGQDTLPSYIPYLLCFTPTDSAVLVFLRASKILLTARVDLDELTPFCDAATEQAASLMTKVMASGADAVIALAYGDDLDDAYQLRSVLAAAAPDGMELEASYHVHGDRWLCLDTLDERVVDLTLPPGGHRAAYSTVTRQDLAELIAGPPVEPAMARAAVVDLDEILAAPDMLDEAEALGLAALVTTDNQQYDRCILAMTLENAQAWSGLWKSVVAHAPEVVASRSLILLGIASWLSGDGVLTTLAQERLERLGCDSPMMELLDLIVRHAIPPQVWPVLVPKVQP